MWAWRAILGTYMSLALFGVVTAADVTCASVTESRSKTRTCYALRTEFVCLPFKPGCGGPASCGKPREVRKLIKRFVKEEVSEVKCVPSRKE